MTDENCDKSHLALGDGIRFKCLTCNDDSLCDSSKAYLDMVGLDCEDNNMHHKDHTVVRIPDASKDQSWRVSIISTNASNYFAH